MSSIDLGVKHGTLLFFGGCYSNLQATQALQQIAQGFEITPENCFCTGDIVAYCAQPNETVQLLRDWGVQVLMGNCEESLATDADDCGCGFAEGSACDVLADNWYAYSVKHLDSAHKGWMRALPRRIDFHYHNRRFAIIHGGVERINQFVFASTPAVEKVQQINRLAVDGIIAGHCGLPFTQWLGDVVWHNPGVIGMPANDGTVRGWYSLWQIKDDRIYIRHHALTYDATAANEAMINAGLGNGYATSLLTGLWPSMDVLPEDERSRCAHAIRESSVIF